MTPDVEKWLPIPGFEGQYEVSDHGRLRGLDRMIVVQKPAGGTFERPHRGRIIATTTKRYERANLHVGSKQHCWLVHRLVAAAFLGPCPEGRVVCHINGDPLDNRASNLRYDTPSGNMRDTLIHGTHPWARRTHCIHGHEWAGENVYLDAATGARRCRTCQRERSKRRRQERENAR